MGTGEWFMMEGRVKDPLSRKKETWLTEKMEKILEIVSSLNLKDAQSDEFIPRRTAGPCMT
jgi:hypothetical protein